jgi:hypothetical protein
MTVIRGLAQPGPYPRAKQMTGAFRGLSASATLVGSTGRGL